MISGPIRPRLLPLRKKSPRSAPVSEVKGTCRLPRRGLQPVLLRISRDYFRRSWRRVKDRETACRFVDALMSDNGNPIGQEPCAEVRGMRLSIVGCSFCLTALIWIGFLTKSTSTQSFEPRPEEAANRKATALTEDPIRDALNQLSSDFAVRRSKLDERRQALQRQRERLVATDLPATEADLGLWRIRQSTSERLGREIQALRALTDALNPRTIQATLIRLKKDAGAPLMPDLGLSLTGTEVNLRNKPEDEAFQVLKEGTLVARLLITSPGGWNVVATPLGIGFVPNSQLRHWPGP